MWVCPKYGVAPQKWLVSLLIVAITGWLAGTTINGQIHVSENPRMSQKDVGSTNRHWRTLAVIARHFCLNVRIEVDNPLFPLHRMFSIGVQSV